MSIILPEKICHIISVLNRNGFRAHAVGGCVRDMLLGKNPTDWDVTTSARPEQVKMLFDRTIDTGLRHGTVTVNYEGQLCEITTWRTDIDYVDHRHPEQVKFTDSLEADLARRDFTINAMAFHPDEGIIDPFGGMEDIKRKLIRSVGNSLDRFSEDALRMLRAIRFSAQLGFEIEHRTYEAIKILHRDIRYVSFERIRNELDKIIASAHPYRLALIWDTGLSDHIFPGIPSFPEICRKACHEAFAAENPIFILSSLLYGAFGNDRERQAESILRRLKYDKRTISEVKKVLSCSELLRAPTQRNIRRACRLYGVRAAEAAAHLLSLEGNEQFTGIFSARRSLFVEPKPPEVSGNDLIKCGIREGREIGIILSLLEMCLYEKPQLNDKETLLLLSREILRKIQSGNPVQ